MNCIEVYQVLLENGTAVWIGTIKDLPFVGRNRKKVALLMEALGLGVMVDTGEYLTAREFLEFSKTHPIFSQVTDWTQMGIATHTPPDQET